MKKLILNLFFVVIGFSSIAQYSFLTEYQYLLLIKNQNNTELLIDNFQNAENTVDQLLSQINTTKEQADFFIQLANGYQTTQDYEQMFVTIIKQRCFFPNPELEDNSQLILKQTYSKLNFSPEKRLIINHICSLKAKDKRAQYENFLHILTVSPISSKEIITKYVHKLNKLDDKKNPYWLNQWQFYTMIGFENTDLSRLIDYRRKTGGFNDFFTQKEELKMEIYKKAFSYFYKKDDAVNYRSVYELYVKEEITERDKTKAKKKLYKIERNKLN